MLCHRPTLSMTVFGWAAIVAAPGGAAMIVDLELVGPMSPRNQAAWWSPIAHHGGSVYVSYLAPNSPQDNVFVAKRLGLNAWMVRDTGFDAAYDVGHTQTSMAIDGEGYLHLFYGMHGHPIRYGRSSQPASVSDGFLAESPSAFGGSAGRYTYPNATTAPNGDVYVILRDQRSSYVAQQGRLFRLGGAGGSWSELPPFAGQSGTTVYPDQVFADDAGQLHVIWEWAAGGAQGARHYGSYARFDPVTNQYFRADGSSYASNPITIAQADIYQGLEGSETFAPGIHGVQSAKLVLDDQGRPIITYGYSVNGTDAGYEHRVARWTGAEWIRSTATPGPFDIDKSWITYSDGMLRFYGTLSPADPAHAGFDDVFLRTSTDYGVTWSNPIPVTQGRNVQRPVGITVDGTDYLYLPDVAAGQLYVASVQPPKSFPYYNDFSSTGLPKATPSFALDAGAGVLNYQRTVGGATVIDAASAPIAGIDGSDFVVSTRFTLDAFGTNTPLMSTVGFGAFGADAAFAGNAANPYYLADVVVNGPAANIGQMRILALGDVSDFTGSGSVAGPSLSAGETYELRLTGAYSDGKLTMTLQMYDESGNSVGASATAADASPLTGQFFGYRNRLVPNSGTTSMSYDEFSVTTAAGTTEADFDGDGDVDGADFLAWQRGVGAAGGRGQGDANSDSWVDGVDLGIWKSQFGETAALAAAKHVPEPSGWTIAAGSVWFAARPGQGQRRPRVLNGGLKRGAGGFKR